MVNVSDDWPCFHSLKLQQEVNLTNYIYCNKRSDNIAITKQRRNPASRVGAPPTVTKDVVEVEVVSVVLVVGTITAKLKRELVTTFEISREFSRLVT